MKTVCVKVDIEWASLSPPPPPHTHTHKKVAFTFIYMLGPGRPDSINPESCIYIWITFDIRFLPPPPATSKGTAVFTKQCIRTIIFFQSHSCVNF